MAWPRKRCTSVHDFGVADDLARVDSDAALGDNVTEEADGGAAELALRGLSVQLVVQQRLEHHALVQQMLLTRLGEDVDVIAVHLHTQTKHGRAGACRPTADRPARSSRTDIRQSK